MSSESEDQIRARILVEIQAEKKKARSLIKDANILQKNKQNKGEQFLKYIKICFERIESLSYEDYDKPRKSPNVDHLVTITPEELRSMIFYEIPKIFDISTWSNSRDHTALSISIERFIFYKDQIELSNKEKKFDHVMFKKYKSWYNKELNLILQKVSQTFIDDEDIIYKRGIISQMQLYNSCGNFDGCTRSLPMKIRVINDQVPAELRRINYDCRPILSNQIQITVKKTFNKSTNKPDHGVAFGFESIEEAFSCFSVAIEKTTVEDLVYEECKKITAGGSFVHNNLIFYLKLPLTHGNNLVSYVSSMEQSMIHIFCNDAVTQKTIEKIFSAPICISGIKTLGLYIKYHNLVVNKIKDLINQRYTDLEFPCIMIPCYRPECSYRNVYSRSEINKPVSAFCQKCSIAEFCLTCGKVSHGGNCDFSQDMMTEDWITNNTKPCPRCRVNVIKSDGCNHMTCRCGVHFCWLCNTEYAVDEINDHYINNNAYYGCIGQADVEELLPNIDNVNQDEVPGFMIFMENDDLDDHDRLFFQNLVNFNGPDILDFFEREVDRDHLLRFVAARRERRRRDNHNDDIFLNWLRETSL